MTEIVEQGRAMKELLEAAKALLVEIELRPGGYDYRPYYQLRASSQLNDPCGAVIRLRKAVALVPPSHQNGIDNKGAGKS